MKRLMLVLFVFNLSGWAAARESYEAKPGLIPPGGLVLFFNSAGPLSYVTLTHHDLPPQATDMGPVQSRSCQYAIAAPITASFSTRTSISGASGNGTYDKALQNLRALHPGLEGIYDVKVDLHDTSFLGIFTRLCTEISARGYR